MTEIDSSHHFSGGNLKTVAKLKIFDWYMEKYVDIMEKNWDEYWYVDTHAGTGKTICDNGKAVDGSTIRALDNYADKFDRFVYYEIDPQNFQTLHKTLSNRFGYKFEVSPAMPDNPDFDFKIARCDNPDIQIMNLDSNDGARILAAMADDGPHWFTFIDPKGLTARRDTIDTLITRENIDILINFQTSGVFRNAVEKSEHGHAAVTRTIGDDDWPQDASEDEYVELFKERLEQRPEREGENWRVQTKNMRDPNDPKYRFDLAFASSNDVAHRIMGHIMNERDDLWEKASEELGQPGLSGFT